MEKLLKLFPLMPQPKEASKLVWAILFYVFVPPIISMIIGALLGVTIILMPLSFVVGLASSAYTIMGIVFAVLRYCGKDLTEGNKE